MEAPDWPNIQRTRETERSDWPNLQIGRFRWTERDNFVQSSQVIIDEAHFLKEPTTFWGIGAALLGRHALRVVHCTGTPFNNRSADISALHLYMPSVCCFQGDADARPCSVLRKATSDADAPATTRGCVPPRVLSLARSCGVLLQSIVQRGEPAQNVSATAARRLRQQRSCGAFSHR